MSHTDMTVEEMFNTLTGYDELHITQTTQRHIVALLKDDPTHGTRCLVAVHRMREDLAGKASAPKDFRAAYAEAMGKPWSDVNDYFAEPAEDFDPESPDSESGKGD